MYINFQFTQDTYFFPFIIYNIIGMHNSFQKFSMGEDKDVIDLYMQLVCLNIMSQSLVHLLILFLIISVGKQSHEEGL